MSSTLRFRIRTALIGSAAIALAALMSTPISAQQRSLGGLGLTMFADENFRGRSATFRDDVADLRQYNLNDQVTSIEVGRGETWEVCEDVNFRGRCQVISGDERDLRRVGWSDTISSARRLRGQGRFGNNDTFGNNRDRDRGFGNRSFANGIELYSSTSFGGRRMAFDQPIANLNDLGFNDRAMSIRVGRGDVWEVCADANYRNCRVIDSDVSDLSRLGMQSRISSLRPVADNNNRQGVFRDNGRFGNNDRFNDARLYLYDQRGFRGQPFVIDNSVDNLGQFNGKAESLRVEGGSWEVCSGVNFRGRCTVINGDESDLGRLGLRNNVNSARLVGRR
jgi:hypothetical protein